MIAQGVQFTSETELQVAIARSPSELASALGRGGQRTIAIPREFRLGNQPIDCLFVSENGDICLVECKLNTNLDLRGKVANQLTEYFDKLRQTIGIKLRADLISYLERYGLKWRQILARDLGPLAIEDKFWNTIDANLQAGRIDVVVAANAFPAETRFWFTKLHQQLPPESKCSLISVEKSQIADFMKPCFKISRAEPGSIRSASPNILWAPVSTQRWRLVDLPKRQRRVDNVNPPAELHIDDTVIWARDPDPIENHAVDPARTASFIPVMPNLELLEKTGTPYPISDHDPTIDPKPPNYRPWLAVGREVWEHLAKHRRFEHPSDTPNVLKRAAARSPGFASHPLRWTHGERGVVTALRDMHLFGLGRLYRRPERRWLFIIP